MPAARALALAFLLLAVALAGCAATPPEPGVRRVCEARPLGPGDARTGATREALAFETSDGVTLVGERWPGHDDHAVVLVHGLNEDRHAFTGLADKLAERGFTVLSFDLRGHGESTERRHQAYEWRNFTAADFQAIEQDVLAAAKVVRLRTYPACMAVVGASLGANAALRAAAAPEGSLSIAALLSPGLDYRGVTTADVIGAYGERPLFLAAARGDQAGAQGAQVLASQAKLATLRLRDGDAHGTNLLSLQGFPEDLVAWLAARA